jgi:protein-S-isoprenylcysteine O-methyltransferase Ste14
MVSFVLIAYGPGKKYSVLGRPRYDEKEKKIMLVLMLTFSALLTYSVFLPLKLDAAWFYAGFFVYLLGMIFVIVAEHNFVTTPVDRPVTKGVYRISRNPIWLGFFLVFIRTGIACAS